MRHDKPSWSNKFGPALGQDPLSQPDAVLEVAQPEANPVAGGKVVVAREDEVAPGVCFQYWTSRTDLAEEGSLRKSEIVLPVRLDDVANDLSEAQRVAVAIRIAGSGRSFCRRGDGVLEDIEGIEVDPHVLVFCGVERRAPSP